MILNKLVRITSKNSFYAQKHNDLQTYENRYYITKLLHTYIFVMNATYLIALNILMKFAKSREV